MKVVRRMLVALLAAPALLLTSCGDDTESGGSSFPTATLSPTPSATAPPKRETAEHFIRRWAAEGTRMQNTGDTAAYLALTKECKDCNSVARLVSRIYQRGGWVRWEGWRIRSIVLHGVGARTLVDLRVQAAPTIVKQSRTAKPEHLHGGREHYQLHLRPNADSWFVTSIIAFSS